MHRLVAFSCFVVGLSTTVAQGAVSVTSLHQNSTAVTPGPGGFGALTQNDVNNLLPPSNTHATVDSTPPPQVTDGPDAEAFQDIQTYVGPLAFLSPSPQLQLDGNFQTQLYKSTSQNSSNTFQLMLSLDASHPYKFAVISDTSNSITFTGPSGVIASNTSGTLLPGSYQLQVLQNASNGLSQDPNDNATFSLSILSVPEPSTLVMLAIGSISLLGYRKSKSHV
jgi:hypothetical protein